MTKSYNKVPCQFRLTCVGGNGKSALQISNRQHKLSSVVLQGRFQEGERSLELRESDLY